ncbi:MAG: DUF4278 domain-containing protein [Leptolyngbya sp. SIO4C5]|uniref:DUF4278 domain-containing protein n=1 Tax=Sphaerothrix gracilis TaxID=3151835 RepID=UPI0013C02D01|nr:DUF4278 domain-containing protein [Leptolyngbya sp. SIO4C5]
MRLFYRGAQYETQTPRIEATEGNEIGTYRGAHFKTKSYRVAQRHHDQVQLTYRGVKYTHEI